MSIDVSTGAGQGNNAYGLSRDESGLSVWSRDTTAQQFGVSRSESGLDLCAGVPSVGGGWAVYTYKASGQFLIIPGAVIPADLLLVGGGGSGGGGSYGGGGGAGGFVDKHDAILYHHGSTPPHDTAYFDGDVTVGEGGATVPFSQGTGNQGGDSSLGGLVAYGGGYGGRNDESSTGYSASGGGSGGGARGNEIYDGEENIYSQYHGIPGEALHNGVDPEGTHPEDYEQGHRGGIGSDATAYYAHTAGGGGGAQWPAYGLGKGISGGLGRPCDIGGWYQGNGLYAEAGWRVIPWFGGGGAGKERANNWSYPDGHEGWGGGGGIGSAGTANTGGGGGGNGWYGAGYGDELGKAPGPAGGSGIVVIRIPLAYKQWVTYPQQVTSGGVLVYESVWDEYEQEYVQTPVYPDGIEYTELDASQTHTDEMGEELPVIWGWPTEHDHRWGWDESHVGV